MSAPGWKGPDIPRVHDQAPAPWTGVPVERDPVSGRLLAGDPLGRGDKGRSTGPGRPARVGMIAGAAAVVVAAAVVLVVVLSGGDPDPAPVAAATTSAAPPTAAPTTSAPPPVETGPREVPVTLTITAVTPPPGFGPDPAFGTVGEIRARTWTITGPCDGEGPCDIQHCRGPGDCTLTFTGVPTGDGYTAAVTTPVAWAAPECTGGEITSTLDFTLTGSAEAFGMTGTWTETTSNPRLTGSDGRDCGIYLLTTSMSSP
jgi:hypothetical protein